MAHTYLPNIHPLDFKNLGFGIHLPEDSELKETFPLPDREFLSEGGRRYLGWSLGEWGLYKEAISPSSEVVRVRLELPE